MIITFYKLFYGFSFVTRHFPGRYGDDPDFPAVWKIRSFDEPVIDHDKGRSYLLETPFFTTASGMPS